MSYYAISNRKRETMGDEKVAEYAELASKWPKDVELGAVDPSEIVNEELDDDLEDDLNDEDPDGPEDEDDEDEGEDA